MILFFLLMLEGNVKPAWQYNLADAGVFTTYTALSFMGHSTISNDGSFIIADRRQGKLIYIGPGGELIVKAGTKGNGPGEFGGFGGHGWVHEENILLVSDRNNLRLSRWDGKGKFLKETTLPEILHKPVFRSLTEIYCLKNASGDAGSRPTISVFNAESGAVNKLWKMPALKESSGHKGKDYRVNMLWEPRLFFDAGNDFIVAMHSSDSKVWILDKKGRELSSFDLNVPRIPFSEELYDLILSAPRMKKNRAKVEKMFPRPDYLPYISRLSVDREGRIWVALHQSSPSTPAPYFVFDKKGSILSQGKIPGAIMNMDGKAIYSISMDEDEDILLSKYPVQ